VYLIISYANDKKLQLSGEVDVHNALMMTAYHGSFLLVSVASIAQMPGLLDFSLLLIRKTSSSVLTGAKRISLTIIIELPCIVFLCGDFL
jgi:hypothetical protein